MGCPVLRADMSRRGVEDIRTIRDMFSAGRGRLIDEEGIDWWALTCLEVISGMEDILIAKRLVPEISPIAELWTTRPVWPGSAWSLLLNRPLRTFLDRPLARQIDRITHYGKLLRRFPAGQIKQIFLDKYDAGYQWRSRFLSAQPRLTKPVILLPSAYENVSRKATVYAQMLPDQLFLLVASRQSAKKLVPQPNVQIRDLATYAKGVDSARETASILAKWETWKAEICASAREFQILLQAGLFDPFPHWFRQCLRARDAWRQVIDREPVSGVLCGDDSNVYTRLPVLLAARRKIPTVDFHHGAMDGHYMIKELACDTYLTKSDMERDYLVRVCGLSDERLVEGAPLTAKLKKIPQNQRPSQTSAILFSEAYEVAGLRAEEIYREILPLLCAIARENEHDVIVKLHPFESAAQRKQLVRRLLSQEDLELVTVVDGPTTPELLSQAWFGITIESTTVIDCLSVGVPCFLCGWLTLSSYGYGPQYARFGIGEMLSKAEEILEIPRRLASLKSAQRRPQSFGKVASSEQLRQLLTRGTPVQAGLRRIS
jgi:hypothetical protein